MRKTLDTLICRVEAAQEADGGHPAAHVLLRLGHQVPGALLRLQVENEAALQLLLGERQASVHLRRTITQGSFRREGRNTVDVSVSSREPALASYLLAEVEVDSSDWPAGLLVLVVLQDIGLAAQTSAPQHKPTPLPGLEEPTSHEFTLTAAFLATVRSSAPERGQAKGYYGMEPSAVELHKSDMTHLNVRV